MSNKIVLCAALALPLLAACQSTSTNQFIASSQPRAIATAEERGRAELSCPAAKGELLSEQDVSPAVGLNMPDRSQFSVRVAGCEKRVIYLVACPDDGSGKCSVVETRR